MGVYDECVAKILIIKTLHRLAVPTSVFLYISHFVKSFCIYLCPARRAKSSFLSPSYSIPWSFHLGPTETGRESERIKEGRRRPGQRGRLPSWTSPRSRSPVLPRPPSAGCMSHQLSINGAFPPRLRDFSRNCFLQTQLIHGPPGSTIISRRANYVFLFFFGSLCATWHFFLRATWIPVSCKHCEVPWRQLHKEGQMMTKIPFSQKSQREIRKKTRQKEGCLPAIIAHKHVDFTG